MARALGHRSSPARAHVLGEEARGAPDRRGRPDRAPDAHRRLREEDKRRRSRSRPHVDDGTQLRRHDDLRGAREHPEGAARRGARPAGQPRSARDHRRGVRGHRRPGQPGVRSVPLPHASRSVGDLEKAIAAAGAGPHHDRVRDRPAEPDVVPARSDSRDPLQQSRESRRATFDANRGWQLFGVLGLPLDRGGRRTDASSRELRLVRRERQLLVRSEPRDERRRVSEPPVDSGAARIGPPGK